jgi:hypothetical protein
VSNRARKACKAILCTGTYPLEPAGRLELPPRVYETRAPPVVLRWHGADGRRRTGALRLTRAMLYLLSYVGIGGQTYHAAHAYRR